MHALARSARASPTALSYAWSKLRTGRRRRRCTRSRASIASSALLWAQHSSWPARPLSWAAQQGPSRSLGRGRPGHHGPRRPHASTVGTAHLGTTGGCCGRGLVTLFSPHLEDGADEAAKAPFRNAIRLCSSFCQHVRTSGAGPEQVRELLESICTGRDPLAEGESAATPSASPSPPPSAPPSPPP